MTEGWTTRQLGDVCTVIAGQSPKAAFYNEIGQGLPFYQGKKEFTQRLIGRPTKWTTFVTKEAEPGDILMSVRAPVGPINQATEKICIGRGLAAIRPHEMLCRDYLWYVLLWLQPTITGNAGAVFESINKDGIERLRIPLPALEEQRRIVAVLDEAFEDLDHAHGYSETNLTDLEELHQSLLRCAFTGELTGHMAESNWQRIRLADIVEIINGRAYKKSELLNQGKYPVLRVGNFFTNQHWYYSDLELPAKNYCNHGDLLYAWSASFGPRIWNGDKTIFHYHIWKILFDESRVLRDFLYYFFDWDKDSIREEQGAGTTMIHVTKKSMEARSIPLPPLEEQQRIVAVLDKTLESLFDVRARAEAKLSDVTDLRKSLLQRAFAGELT